MGKYVAPVVGGVVGALTDGSLDGSGGVIPGVAKASSRNTLRYYDSEVLRRVNRAASECESAATLADPSGDHNMCKVYDDISDALFSHIKRATVQVNLLKFP